MDAARTSSDPAVVVVGGGLAGMAAAARLAKAGHTVELLEASETLGGSWAPRLDNGVWVDDAPGVLGFPAPWRDLFRKSGRPLEAELARMGYSLQPAPAPLYAFADGSRLRLPTDRGEQYETIAETYGTAVAGRWRDLVDGLDTVWQAVRPLGLEAELRGRDQLRQARRVLRPRLTLDGLADQVGEPHLKAVIASIAYRLGSTPGRTPAWCGVEASINRTFGRWTVQAEPGSGGAGRSSVLVDALATRLEQRQVRVHLGRPVTALDVRDGRVLGVATANGRIPAAAIICTANPWHTYADLLDPRLTRRALRALSRVAPAMAPDVEHELSAEPTGEVTETVLLAADGTPTVHYVRPATGGTLRTVQDYRRSTPTPSAGLAWDGFSSWLRRPPITTDIAGLFLAGPFSRGGNGTSQVLLSGALASYACHDYLT